MSLFSFIFKKVGLNVILSTLQMKNWQAEELSGLP